MSYRAEDEALLARDLDGTLVPLRQVDVKSYDELANVTLVHRGQAISLPVPLAAPKRNAQGGIVYSTTKAAFDARNQGRQLAEPRRTTALDAVNFIMRRSPAWRNSFGDSASHPIPTLCHRDHLDPVGNCRVCCVILGRINQKTNELRVDNKPTPACWQQIENNMVIFTPESAAPADTALETPTGLVENILKETNRAAAKLRDTISTLSHLLIASARNREFDNKQVYHNELDDLAERVKNWDLKSLPGFSVLPVREEWREQKTRQAPKAPEHPIRVDLNSCIVCNRCVRSCNDVKGYNVLGRLGKGKEARIGFDADRQMVDSTCVGCGECMISCPTGALTFRQPLGKKATKSARGFVNRIVSCDELQSMVFKVHDRKAGGTVQRRIFNAVPKSFLLWHEGQVIERSFEKRLPMMTQGEFGTTAFLLLEGEFEVSLPHGTQRLKAEDEFILGEMACIAGTPRSATVHALPGARVLEIGRNFLFQMQRIGSVREALDDLYVQRALRLFEFGTQKQFLGLDSEQAKTSVEKLLATNELRLVRLDPGVKLFERGDPADAMYVLRLGHVKVSLGVPPNERVLDYLRPGAIFGEIALIAECLPSVAHALADLQLMPGFRSAGCAALDHVEAVRIPKAAFQKFWSASTDDVKQEIERWCLGLLEDQRKQSGHFLRPLDDFVARGLHEGQSMLVLDLEACTRCDECTKACSDTHKDGHNRLTRDGDRFGNYLVASSCRSCHDPLCLVGCPTDAIRRERQSLAIRIDNAACIGCELCANNCPFGNIKMTSDVHGRGQKATKAVVCDLCEEVPGKPGPMCVNACPHDAAHRVDGVGLFIAASGVMPLRKAAAKSKSVGFVGISLRTAVREATNESVT